MFFVCVEQSRVSDKCLEVAKKARAHEDGLKTSETIELVHVRDDGLNCKSDNSAAKLAVNGFA